MRYASKRAEVEAFQYIAGRLPEAPAWFLEGMQWSEGEHYLEITYLDLMYHVFPSQWIIRPLTWELIILDDHAFRALFESASRNPFESPEGGEIFRCEMTGRERHVTRLDTAPKGDLHVFYRDVRDDGDYGEVSCSIHAWRRWSKHSYVFIVRQN